MSKLINLTGLSKAIKNIKDWVLKQRTHYLKKSDEQILYQNVLDKDNVYFRDNRGSYWYLPKGTKLPDEGMVKDYTLYSVKDNSIKRLEVNMSDDGSHEAYFAEDNGITLIDVTQLPEVYIPNTIVKTTPQTLSEDDKNQVKENLGISNPNWDAQEGEDGFIKNKPYEIFKSTIEKVDDNTLRIKIAEDESPGEYHVLGHYIKWEYSLYNLQHDETNLQIGSGREILSVTYDDGYYYLTHSSYNADYMLSEFVDYPESSNIFYVVKGIDATCLTDNVVKTLPQNLTSIDKSQVLTNLGIDPVVWKYMCNPYIISLPISDGDEIPEDLAEVISKNINYSRLTVSLSVSGEIYFANGIGNSEYLMFNIPDSDPIYIGFNGKNVFTA